MRVEQVLHVVGGRCLQGKLDVPAAKNSVLPILAASLLCAEVVELQGVPCLGDVQTSCALLEWLGSRVRWQGDTLTVWSRERLREDVPAAQARAMRSSVFYLAPLLHRVGRVRLPLPGGCNLGARPIDIHLDGLHQMGARVSCEEDGLQLWTTKRLQGVDYTLRLPSVGATETLLMAAAIAQGQTVLRGAAREPEVADLARFLCACGAQIEGAGTDVVRVCGVESLHGCQYWPVADRIVAATAVAAVAAAGGAVELHGCDARTFAPVLEALGRAGCGMYAEAPRVLHFWRRGPLRGAGAVHTGAYPAFPTDAAPLLAAAMLPAQGYSQVVDTIFERRFACAAGFAALGARVQRRGAMLEVWGGQPLRGACLQAQDLRGGAALGVAALAASGESQLYGMAHVRRGYEDMAALLRALGAQAWTEWLSAGPDREQEA